MKRLFLFPAAILLLLSFALPGGWYEELPWPEDFTRPSISGLFLLRVCLAIDAAILVAIASIAGSFKSEGLGPGLFPGPGEDGDSDRDGEMGRRIGREFGDDITGPGFILLFAGVMLVAFATRFYRLGTDLWVDEIVTVLTYGQNSVVELFALSTNLNNHLLNTLLVKLSVAVFGQSDWSIRLPAALAGVATVPALYWVSRFALSRGWSLGVALLLAVSYHHIFFSQNSRGYSPYILFSVLSTGLLLKAIKEDRLAVWLLFVAATVLNFASHLNAAFVAAGHAILGGWMILRYRRSISFVGPLARHGVGSFVLAAYLSFHVYAMILPNALAFVSGSYGWPVVDYGAYLAKKAAEVVAGVTGGAGAAAWLALVPVMALGSWGLVNLWRKNWLLLVGLLLPNLVMMAVLVLRELRFQPRFFVFAMPVFYLGVASGFQAMTASASRRLRLAPGASRAMGVALILIAAAGSALPLIRYYSMPKQDFRGGIARALELRRGAEPIVAVYLADWGFGMYAAEFGIREGQDYFFARKAGDLKAVVAAHPGEGVYLVSTLHGPLAAKYPEMLALMKSDWEVDRVLPGSLGGGNVAVWKPRGSPRP